MMRAMAASVIGWISLQICLIISFCLTRFLVTHAIRMTGPHDFDTEVLIAYAGIIWFPLAIYFAIYMGVIAWLFCMAAFLPRATVDNILSCGPVTKTHYKIFEFFCPVKKPI